MELYQIDGTFLTSLQGHQAAINDVNFTSVKANTPILIATASSDNTVKLWNLKGKEIKTFKGHKNYVLSVNFSPDGQIIASGSRDETVKLWSLDGKEIKTLHTRGNVLDVNFSPNGKMLAAAVRNKIMVWNWELGSLLEQGCNWVHDYLKNSLTVNEEYRYICEGIDNPKTKEELKDSICHNSSALVDISDAQENLINHYVNLAKLHLQPLESKASKGDTQTVIQLFQQALEISKKRNENNPDTEAEVLRGLGILYLRTKQLQSAKDSFKALFKIDRHSDVAAYILGYIAELENNLDNALFWYKKVNGGDGYLPAQTQIATILVQQGELDSALKHLHTISVAKRRDKLKMIQFEAELLINKRHYVEAIALYDRILSIHYDSTDLLLK